MNVAGWYLTSVNDVTKEKSPSEVLEQVETVRPCIIKTLETAPLYEDPIHFSKLDIKYGFWKMVCAVGE